MTTHDFHPVTHLLDKVVLALVAEYDVDLLGAGAADVRAEHDVVGRVAVHVGLVELAVEELNVAATAVDVLLVLDRELDHEGLVPENIIKLQCRSVYRVICITQFTVE